MIYFPNIFKKKKKNPKGAQIKTYIFLVIIQNQ